MTINNLKRTLKKRILYVKSNNSFLLNYKYKNNMSGHQMVTGDQKKKSVCGHQKITKN